MKPKVATCLWYDGCAEEAASFYTLLLSGSEMGEVTRFDPHGPAVLVGFTLGGTPFQALNGGPQYEFTKATSISVSTADQEETDRLWSALTADGGEEGQFGWLKDRFGMSWQIVPEALPRLLGSADREAAARALQATSSMRKIDIAALEAAYAGEAG